MPLELTDAELATAATACRAMAYQEGKRAREMENPTMRGPIQHAAERYARLAERLEATRRLPSSGLMQVGARYRIGQLGYCECCRA